MADILLYLKNSIRISLYFASRVGILPSYLQKVITVCTGKKLNVFKATLPSPNKPQHFLKAKTFKPAFSKDSELLISKRCLHFIWFRVDHMKYRNKDKIWL
jgi:hypothetical protein